VEPKDVRERLADEARRIVARYEGTPVVRTLRVREGV
jgi:hypothetical protein